MFVGVVRSLPKSGASEIYMERPVRDKHSSLLQKFVNFGQKIFIILTLGVNDIIIFYVHTLPMFVIS